MSKAKLFMIPSLLGEGDPQKVLGKNLLESISKIRYFIVESEKSARRFIVRCGLKDILPEVEFGILNEHTPPKEYSFLLEPLFEGQDTGILSDAGCPGIADPGAELVAIAHRNSIQVIPLIGPSSIILAVMASGLNGQSFAFRGYLDVKSEQRIKQLRELEKRSEKEYETQIFIEAPYRNMQLFQDMLKVLSPDTRLCLACNITQPDEFIKTMPVKHWKKRLPDIQKKPTVFLFLV